MRTPEEMGAIGSLLEANDRARRRLVYAPKMESPLGWSDLQPGSQLENPTPGSIYIHLPFCQRYCSFCGCNTSITGDHGWEERYLELLKLERDMRFRDLSSLSVGRGVFGGGTPTFFSAKNLEKLLHLFSFPESGTGENSVEVDPRFCHADQVEVLGNHGFRRFLLSLVDLHPGVQKSIERVYRNCQVEETFHLVQGPGRELSCEFLLGLPGQSHGTLEVNLEFVKNFLPMEVQIQRFIPVPWLRYPQGQDQPGTPQVNAWILQWLENLVQWGYVPLGFGRWVLKSSPAWEASQKNDEQENNHRGSDSENSNSQKRWSLDISGFHRGNPGVLLGFGVGALSQTPLGMTQNHRKLPLYQRALERGESGGERGVSYSDRDRKVQFALGEFLNQGVDSGTWREYIGLESLPPEMYPHFLPLVVLKRLERYLLERPL